MAKPANEKVVLIGLVFVPVVLLKMCGTAGLNEKTAIQA